MLIAERNTDSLRIARDAILDVSRDINRSLTSYEGTGAVLSFGNIAADVNVNLSQVTKAERYAFMMAAEAALDFRGWTRVEGDGLARFTKPTPTVTYRKPRMSPTARARSRKP